MKRILLGLAIFTSMASFSNDNTQMECKKFTSSITFNDEYLDNRLKNYCDKVASLYTLSCVQIMGNNFDRASMGTLESCRLYTNEMAINALSDFLKNEGYMSINNLNALSAVNSKQESQCIKGKYGQEERLRAEEIESCLHTSAFVLDMREIENGDNYNLRTQRAKMYVRELKEKEYAAEKFAKQEQLALDQETKRQAIRDVQFHFIADGKNLLDKLVRSFIVGLDNLIKI